MGFVNRVKLSFYILYMEFHGPFAYIQYNRDFPVCLAFLNPFNYLSFSLGKIGTQFFGTLNRSNQTLKQMRR
jgi:hypothetical protein